MEKDKLQFSRFEYDGSFSETRLAQKSEKNLTSSALNTANQGSILFTKKYVKKRKPFNWIRIRSFFIKHKKFKRMMEFSCHPTGVHLLKLAVFYSESGCGMCKVYVEKNLF